MSVSFPKIAQLKTVTALRERLAELQLTLPVDDEILSAEQDSPLADPIDIGEFRVGNRWCIHPMEGWDANGDGSPSEHTLRRWRNFGLSGAKLIWGGEAAAVVPEGRANPNQTLAVPGNRDGLARLRDELIAAHRDHFSTTDDLLIGLQLTHSGRFCCPNRHKNFEPRIAYHHPLLDPKFGIDPGDDSVVLTDDDLERLADDYVTAACLAHDVGYQFVDVKACHGYLLHELLSARTRTGRFGGDFEGRTRMLTTIIERIGGQCPGLMIGVRLSAFDVVPFQQGTESGEPAGHALPYQHGFGLDPQKPLDMDLTETFRLLEMLKQLGVISVNISCGSPYYSPHIQRPAAFPPSDGYLPPEDPLVGVVRQIQCARRCKEAVPGLPIIGTGYSYLQDYLPQVAQAVVREGWVDVVGLGRMVLSYPEMPADTLAGRPLARKRVCRTFSDCTTAPRAGILSGCFPLDAHYKQMPQADQLRQMKQAAKQERPS